MLRFARQEAFCDDDFPMTMTRRVINRNITPDFFLPDLCDLAKSGDSWVLKSFEDFPEHVQVFGLKVPLPEVLKMAEQTWELKLWKYGGWDVFSINDVVLAVLGGDDEPPGILPPGGMPLGIAFCARKSIQSLPKTARVTHLLVQCKGELSHDDVNGIAEMSQLLSLELTCPESGMVLGCLPPTLNSLDLNLFMGRITPGCLDSLVHLEELKLSQAACSGLFASGKFMQCLPQKLLRLALQLTADVDNLVFLRVVTKVQELDITWAPSIESIGEIAGLVELECLTLHGFEKIQDLSPMKGLEKLRKLSIGGMDLLTNLDALCKLHKLRSLTFIQCESLEDVSPLAILPGLRILSLFDCDNVSDLSMFDSSSDVQVLR